MIKLSNILALQIKGPSVWFPLYFIRLFALHVLSSNSWFFKEGWPLKPPVDNKSINSGTTNRDLAQKIHICDFIDQFFWHLDVIKHLSVQTRFVTFFLSAQPLSTYFGTTTKHTYKQPKEYILTALGRTLLGSCKRNTHSKIFWENSVSAVSAVSCLGSDIYWTAQETPSVAGTGMNPGATKGAT